ncbi:MAG: hypothetical protein GW808_08605 [Sphingomonadales bacterium]|nr:hypothetical protein [Sphingomonadales bacterium]NCO49489.1 hypothetical protein [Sphingomonadales bacterium]NCO99037.1 hypothetical protein [Sphingomonadales bacterium]NCP26610.1 hypothetical protein [Sphingomonadales bacterium]NCP44642.1 hypothetical protein [Sphingomonadales bacterium]
MPKIGVSPTDFEFFNRIGVKGDIRNEDICPKNRYLVFWLVYFYPWKGFGPQMNIIRRLRANLSREKSYRSFKKKHYRDAIVHLSKTKKLRPLNKWEMAYSATLEIGADNSIGAKKIFYDTLTEIELQPSDVDDCTLQYVCAYCKMYISLIRKTNDHMVFFDELLTITPRETISEFLPLPDKEVMLGLLDT